MRGSSLLGIVLEALAYGEGFETRRVGLWESCISIALVGIFG
jgi:hypothetical protein